MKNTLVLLSIIFFLVSIPLSSQSLFDNISSSVGNDYKLGGFIRSGLYMNIPDGSASIPVSFAGLSLNAEAGNNTSYKAYFDIRYRYAREYGENVNKPALREAWAAWYTPYTQLKAGKQIIKWSRMDFFRLQDVTGPRNDLYRSFDPEDRYLGNISIEFRFKPSENISLNALIIPRYRPSVLYVDFIDLPDIIEIGSVSPGYEYAISYGLRAEYYLRNFTADISFFTGYNPLPGLALDTISILSGNNIPLISLEEQPFKVRTLSSGLEFAPGKCIIRAEAMWMDPEGDYRENEYIMLPEIRWAAGLEYFIGDLQVLFEYSGKHLLNFEESVFDPELPDESSFSEFVTLPPDQILEYTRMQIGSFNRLYYYQLNKLSHYAGLRLAYEKGFSFLSPSVNLLYNITAGEYMVKPVLKIKPSDNLQLIAGAEIYIGTDNSLFDMINDKLNSLYAGMKVHF
ncbi:MAG TPA: hypothetical protein DEQ09_03330 [Bacteroidales bacterium]|nr:hypothetical protein [Bacteroidales bacterium]